MPRSRLRCISFSTPGDGAAGADVPGAATEARAAGGGGAGGRGRPAAATATTTTGIGVGALAVSGKHELHCMLGTISASFISLHELQARFCLLSPRHPSSRKRLYEKCQIERMDGNWEVPVAIILHPFFLIGQEAIFILRSRKDSNRPLNLTAGEN